MAQSLYEVLGVHPSATAEEIEAASIRLGEQHHPDNNKGKLDAAIRFKQIEQAYEVLSDPEKRSAYDRSISIEKDFSRKLPTHRRLTGLGVFSVTFGVVLVAFGTAWLVGNKGSSLGAALICVIGLIAIAVGYIRLREEIDTSVAAQKSSFFSGRFTRFLIVIGGFFCAQFLAIFIGLAFNSAVIFPAAAPPVPSAQTPMPPATVQKSARTDAKLDAATLDSCFLTGKAAATVYLANFAELAKNDILPSDVMKEGCARKGATTQNPNECIYNCELGFKATARKALK